MLKSLRITLIISFITAFYIYLNVYPSSAFQDTGLERQRNLQAISGLEEDANRLAQELVVLDLKLKKAEQERELIKKELADTRKKKDDAAGQYKKSLEIQNQSLKKIGLWLNFQYRYGYWSLLDIILGSDSLPDLINRTAAVAIILGRQAKDYRQAAEACAVVLQKEKAMKEAEEQLNLQNQALSEQINNIQNISEERKEFLAEIKRNSLDLARKVASLERKFLESLNLVDFLTNALAKFSWQEVKPDRVTVASGGIVVELTEASLNRSLQASGVKDLEGLSVSLGPGMFTLTGRDKNSPSMFSLGGSLAPTDASTAVRLEPKALSLDGIPVTGDVVREMAANSSFYLPIPADVNSFKPSRIDISEGKMTIILTL